MRVSIVKGRLLLDVTDKVIALTSELSYDEYKGISAAEFFYRNREIAGFSNPTRALYQTVRELVENALDATELYGVRPSIKLEISLDSSDPSVVTVKVEDNGIGIPKEEVPFVFGRVFYGSKYTLKQSRGVFGLGIKMAVLYAQITTGKPIYIKSSTPSAKDIYEYELLIDINKNIPVILNEKVYKKRGNWHGTIVSLTIEGNWSNAKKRIEEYIKRTALIAPYAEISLKAPDLEVHFPRSTKALPTPPKEGKPHPYGVDLEMLKSLIARNDGNTTIKEFLLRTFDGVGRNTVLQFLSWAGIKENIPLKKLTVEELEILARKMRDFPNWRRPRSITLSPLGEELLIEGVRKILNPEFVAAISRKPSSYSGHPFIVEVAIAFGGGVPVVDRPLLYRFANKIPLLYDEGVDVSRKVVDNIDWSYYKVKMPAPLAVIVHICSTKMPFKGVGKEAIAEVPEIEKEVENAVKEVARRLRRHISKMEKLFETVRRRVEIEKYIPEVARALSEITKLDQRVFERKLKRMLRKKVLTLKEEGVVS